MIHSQFLKVNGVDMNKYALGNGTVTWTDPLDTHLSKGNASIEAQIHSGDIDIHFQVARGIDKPFFFPIDVLDSDLSMINLALVSDSWIVYDTMLARAQRFRITANAASNVTLDYIQQEY